MSAIVLVGLPLIGFAALLLWETEIGRIVKDLIDLLVRTTTYSSEKIIRIINLYF
jgi:hypothetical protein